MGDPYESSDMSSAPNVGEASEPTRITRLREALAKQRQTSVDQSEDGCDDKTSSGSAQTPSPVSKGPGPVSSPSPVSKPGPVSRGIPPPSGPDSIYVWGATRFRMVNYVVLQAVHNGPRLTQSIVDNIALGASAVWTLNQNEAHPGDPASRTITVGGQEVGVALVEHVFNYQRVSGDFIRTMFLAALNFALAQGGSDGVGFDIEFEDDGSKLVTCMGTCVD